MTGALVPLRDAHDAALFGAKAVGLGEAVRAGLPVPPGVALSGEVVDAVAAADERETARVVGATASLSYPVAVRSSAVDEDGADASFAGQHVTLLNVTSPARLGAAIRQVWWSANSDAAIGYRKRVGLFTRPSVGVVVQSLLDPEVAGVMFTRNPINGADERMIEASWGLGEAVVAGRVIPDHFRVARSGAVLERRAGVKDVAIRRAPDGGTTEAAVAPDRVAALSLGDDVLGVLGALATRCEEIYGPARDIEWAYADGQVYLLQCRAVTHAAPPRHDPPAAPDVVAAVPLFVGLGRQEVARIAGMFKERAFAAGETIIQEGVSAAAFFVIESGEATVAVHGQEVSTLRRGDYFGEVALIDEGARSATITARTDLVCHGLTYWEFRPLVQGNATIAWNLLQTLALRLRNAQRG